MPVDCHTNNIRLAEIGRCEAGNKQNFITFYKILATVIIMTTIYFVRHAESDRLVRDGRTRPLTKKGLIDRRLVTDFLSDKKIDIVLSSPFKRAVDTVADFAEKYGFNIEHIEDFREQQSGKGLPRDKEGNPSDDFLRKQWDDFNFRYSDGETLHELRQRNIVALTGVLMSYSGKNIVIGTHAMALSTIINYYDASYGFDDFLAMNPIMPWIVRMDFDGDILIKIEKINLFADLGKNENKYQHRRINLESDKNYILECHCRVNYACDCPWARKISYEEYKENWFSNKDQQESFLSALIESMADERTIAEIIKTDSGETVAYFWVPFHGEDESFVWADVQDLYIEEAYRGTGLAAYLMDYAEKSAKSHGAKVIRSGTGCENIPSQKLHRKMGYYQYRMEYEKLLEQDSDNA